MGARNVIVSAVAALAVTALLPSSASAFCRMSTCQPNKETCGPDPDNTSCTNVGDKTHARLFWSQPCVGFSIQQDTTVALPGSPADRYALVEKIANTGFATWQNATCADGKAPSLAFADLGPVACNKHEYNPSQPGAVAQGNANILLFRADTWPYAGAANAFALTTDTYNVDSGEIYDADIEINAHPVGGTLTTGDTNTSVDLLSIVTHEAGHFLGLGHSPDASATMFGTYAPGDTSHRILHPDDVAAVCALYPSTRVNLPACDPTPRHGYSSDCAEVTTSPKGCAAAPGRGGALGALAALSTLGLAAALKRRRARR